MKQASSTQVFSATIDKVDINPYVKVPDPVVAKLLQDANQAAGPIPVSGTLQGRPFTATVVRFRGVWRLYLNTAMRRAAHVDVGSQTVVEVQFDSDPRSEPVPPKLALALAQNPDAHDAFERLTPSRRKEILRYLNSLKREASLERNIGKVLQSLQTKKAPGRAAARSK